jgi:hypothetical protein
MVAIVKSVNRNWGSKRNFHLHMRIFSRHTVKVKTYLLHHCWTASGNLKCRQNILQSVLGGICERPK